MYKATNSHTSEVKIVNIVEAIELLKGFEYYIERADLFEHPELLPDSVRALIEHEIEGYEECDKLIADLKPLGYTCNYGLDGLPVELTKITTEE